ncbi:cyclic nucleotide-binding domain-containing protein [Streptomyces sp. NPDC058045]|uniref:cyclic nucleotide-binding domain-containing protein n=1 Tax=Streptomyces sp. NPDC058045 TaxID=3346311 RepID=UPI0036EC87C1
MTTMTTKSTMLGFLTAGQRDQLLRAARDVSYPAGRRMFEEGRHADRFWVVRSGTVVLDLRVPGRRSPAVDTLGPGDLVGWSWLYTPHVWHLGGQTASAVRAWQFDAASVRRMCAQDPELGRSVEHCVGVALARRLRASRTRLLSLYGPYSTADEDF